MSTDWLRMQPIWANRADVIQQTRKLLFCLSLAVTEWHEPKDSLWFSTAPRRKHVSSSSLSAAQTDLYSVHLKMEKCDYQRSLYGCRLYLVMHCFILLKDAVATNIKFYSQLFKWISLSLSLWVWQRVHPDTTDHFATTVGLLLSFITISHNQKYIFSSRAPIP